MRFTPRQRRCLTVSFDEISLAQGKLTLVPAPPLSAEVSAAGLSLESAEPLPEGTPVRGTLALEGEAFPFSGEVSWARAGDARLSLRGRMGVRFTDAPDALWAKLG
jgi:hypothetical protein